MTATFTPLTPYIFYGIFPKQDISKGLEYISKAMPKGDKKILVIDGQDTLRMNGYTELVKDIQVDYEINRLMIIEILTP